ncbi:MAG TPA: hypothetical protein VG389_23490 [Myxococcota bacterium]|jgi:hypothetical protein|nr:hypothetical protein [Myxococcota bacterium]
MALTPVQRKVLDRIRATMEERFAEPPLRARAAIDGVIKVRSSPNAELSALAGERLARLAETAQARGLEAGEAGALLRIGIEDADTGPYFQKLLRFVPPAEVIALLLDTD